MTTTAKPYTPPQTAADQVAALAPYYTSAAEAILGSEGDHPEARRMVALAATRLVAGHAEYGAEGLFSAADDEVLANEEDDEIADAINYRAERLRRHAEGINIPDPARAARKLVR